MNIKKYKNVFIAIAIILVIAVIIYVFMPSRAATGQNDFMINESSNLEYYINVMYDGQDETATVSSGLNGASKADVYSDYIYVEDKLPEGTTYNGLVLPDGETASSWDCTYGAVEQADATKSCSGYVVGASKVNNQCQGINYDSSTRIVSFAVKGLQAGCKLTVGIKTTTGTLGNNDRIDLFNTAYAWEEQFTAKSNQVHVFMGNLNSPTFNTVTYSYGQNNVTGVTLPALPDAETHIPGVQVGVAKNLVLEGYEFSGWTTSDATVSNGKFTMPNGNVTFTGTFTKKTEYTVTYATNVNTSLTGYVPPITKSYGVGDMVPIEEVDENHISEEYTFEGWSTSNVTSLSGLEVKNGSFVMPSNNVTLTGRFEPTLYSLTYVYKGSVPSGVTAPTSPARAAGSQVTVPQVNNIPQGYRFLGWYSDDTFTMPNNNVTIYGEWAQILPTFAPTITAVAAQDVVQSGETEEIEITIENEELYAITDVVVRSDLTGCEFNLGDAQNPNMSQTYEISSIAAGESVTLTAYYTETLTNVPVKALSSKFRIVNAVGDSVHEFYTDEEISSTVSFAISDIVLEVATVDEVGSALSGTTFKLCTNSAATTCMKDSNDDEIHDTHFVRLGPGRSYYLKQTYVPTGYMAFAGPAEIIVASDGTVTAPGYSLSTGNNGEKIITIINEPLNILPETGGIGNIPFIIGGAVIVIGSLGYFIYYSQNKNKKKKNKERKGGDN